MTPHSAPRSSYKVRKRSSKLRNQLNTWAVLFIFPPIVLQLLLRLLRLLLPKRAKICRGSGENIGIAISIPRAAL